MGLGTQRGMTENRVVRHVLLELERAGRDSLCNQTGSEYYGELMLPNALMALANGMVLDRDMVVSAPSESPPWRTYAIGDVRLHRGGQRPSAAAGIARISLRGTVLSDSPGEHGGVVRLHHRFLGPRLDDRQTNGSRNATADRGVSRCGLPSCALGLRCPASATSPMANLGRHIQSGPDTGLSDPRPAARAGPLHLTRHRLLRPAHTRRQIVAEPDTDARDIQIQQHRRLDGK